ncbi:MAG: chorismate synthase [Nitrospirae bacterium 13_2_20CM_2_62_8]|nr:MAG: chorismate synthase [Nitrospirae bacterium 13_2_20CM_2_62_8]OLC40564.1 MAG: chorismate synthase [Nitrospirae bacterium 13_1_40CM_4_62_6]OLC80021.1 MAG: chorismate synthase [Nitrospirae bacterium 13_1_40CM_3_62_11]OLD39074.1 MAG: chorismate synthase [Nitrospirae bacterium 13_1_40CM_2_62_10]
MLRYLNAGESHGKSLLAVLEGVPAGLPLTPDLVNQDLARRQKGYGRGGRMRLEEDRVEFVCGVRKGQTLGNPIGLMIANKDWENWKEVMAVEPGPVPADKVVTRPRPGHADLVGAIKYAHRDIRNVLEKASARETAIRVAVGGVAKALLAQFSMRVLSYTTEIGGVVARRCEDPLVAFEQAETSDVRSPDPDAGARMIERIRTAKHRGDTLGGVFEVVVTNPPIGLGSYSQWDRRLGARLAMAVMSIQAMKGVEIGMGFDAARRFGSEVHDDIYYEQGGKGFIRKTNNAGGLEGGITNGEPIVLRVAMKPISTLYSPKKSVDIETKQPFDATVERSDICTVPAAGVVGEAVVAFEIANAMIDKFGGDSLEEMKRNYHAYQEYVKAF